MPNKHHFLIALVAPVGSGKSYIANILAHKLHARRIRTDDIRVALRAQGKPYSRAPLLAKQMIHALLAKRNSVIADFDAVFKKRQAQLKRAARIHGANFFLIKIKTPERVILERLQKKRYTKNDLFQHAAEAIRVYFVRKKFHEKSLPMKPHFVINNGKPLPPQIKKIVARLKGL